MKRAIKVLMGFIFTAALALFAVALVGQAFNGNKYAAALFVAEVCLVIYPLVVDERKHPQWQSTLWTWSIAVWFVCAMIWSVFQINLL
ncbi:MAG: hypothetical protein IJ770_03375 [Alphaproteobacteria bacterium]|nr:hypothetical protein [Alphaproteobacteria bacterium]